MVFSVASALGSALSELTSLVNRVVRPEVNGPFEAHLRVGSLWALRSSQPTQPSHALYTPMLCVVAQGAKQIHLGDETHIYNRGNFLLNSVALPAAGQVIEASPDAPCLWVMIELEAALVASVIAEVGVSNIGAPRVRRAMEVSCIDASLLDAVLRLTRLLESPHDMDFLAPLVLREIIYRLLQSDQAARLYQIAGRGGQVQRVMGAIEWLSDNFAAPLRIETLARQSGMSVSALHHHFKEVTAMSPLQFQKQMRLQEAKRLLMSQDLDVAGAGFKVGYDDPSYFSRDYRRFFGDSPLKHLARVRGEVAGAV